MSDRVKVEASAKHPSYHSFHWQVWKPSWPACLLVIAGLTAAIAIHVIDGQGRFDFVEKISKVSFAEAPQRTLPISPGAFEEHLVIPYYSMDARWWIIHTRQMLRDKTWRVRHTEIDNAPQGREVHWSSSIIWMLAGCASIISLFRGTLPESCVAEASMFIGPVTIVLCFGLLLGLAYKRYGLFPSAFFLLVLLTTYPVMRSFLVGETDHHGLVAMFATASAFCVVAGGGGLIRRAKPHLRIAPWISSHISAKRWFALAGVLGAAAIWISAATALPVLAGIGIGGFLCGVLLIRAGLSESLDPNLWKIWGLWGCVGCVGFYLLEYFPSHMAFRMEVNNPLYGLAWLGAAYASHFALKLLTKKQRNNISKQDYFTFGASVLVAAFALLLVYLFPEKVFWVSNRYLLDLHSEFIYEFQSLSTLVNMSGGSIVWMTYYPWVIAVIVIWAARAMTGQLSLFSLVSGCTLLPAVLIMQALALHQVRWSSISFALWGLAALFLVIDLLLSPKTKLSNVAVYALVGTAWIALLISILPTVAARSEEERTCMESPIPKDIAGNLLLRDVSHRLIQSSPDRLPVVLTGPNASTEMAYHAGVHTVGTLYWENLPGLKTLAEIFSARDEKTAKDVILRNKITHIVLPSWDNFALAFAKVLAKSHGDVSTVDSYLINTFKSDQFPDWLRPFAYPIPTLTGLDTQSIQICAVIPEQNQFEANYYQGIYHQQNHHYEKAKVYLTKALNIRPLDSRAEAALKSLPNR